MVEDTTPESMAPVPAHGLPVSTQLRHLMVAAIGLAVLVVLFMTVKWLLHSEPATPPALPPGVVQLTDSQAAGLKIEPAGVADGWERTDATGQIAVDDTLATPVFLPYSGQVTDVFVQAGDAVVPGQPLLRVRTGDVVDARNALFAADAAHATASAQLRLAEANLARQEAIYKTAGGALKDYQQAQNDLVTAQSALRNADSAQGAARDKMAVFGKSGAEIASLEAARNISGINAETAFHAPIAGIISQRAVSAGQYVQSGGSSPVLVIANPMRVWLVAQLAESDAANVHIGDGVDVTVPSLGGRVFHATIDHIAAALDPGTHRLQVSATIANTDRSLKPQMFANFTIRHRAAGDKALDGVTVPAQAVIHEGDAARVWVVIGKNRLQARDVTVADAANGQVRITGGLKTGERVVSRGAIFVNEEGLGE